MIGGESEIGGAATVAERLFFVLLSHAMIRSRLYNTPKWNTRRGVRTNMLQRTKASARNVEAKDGDSVGIFGLLVRKRNSLSTTKARCDCVGDVAMEIFASTRLLLVSPWRHVAFVGRCV
jgi:hypothetical protein